tara:strand:- start:163 stop:600 length:438 start_codon:yes stop_codon:yes gene_type:complete
MDNIITIEFTVMGEPKGKGRPRFSKVGRVYTPRATAEYEATVRQAAWVAMAQAKETPTEKDVYVELLANHGVPASWPKKKQALAYAGAMRPKRPDLDNVVKAVLDGANNVIYRDDAQVHSIRAMKRYAPEGIHPSLLVRMSWSKD